MLGATQGEPLVGRARELEIGRTMLEAASAGRPHVLALTGEAGIGKSRLARAITAEATARGAIALWGAGQEDLALPYLPIATALDPLGHDRLRSLDGIALPSAPERSPAEIWGDVTDLLLAAAARTPVVLVMDDLQWTDPASQALLQHLLVVLDHAATTRAVRLLTVVTVRTPLDDDRTVRTLSRLEREPHAVTLEVAGLDRTEVRDLLGIIGPAPPSAALAHRIMESTSGNPLLAQSVLRRGLDEGRITVDGGTLVAAPDDPLAVGADELDRAVVARLDRVGDACRDLLTIAAFLGDHHAIVDVAALAGVALPEAEDLVDEAIEADLLRDLGARCSFSHPQVRHVLFNAPRRRARQRLHLQMADGLEARGEEGDAPAIAHHLARAGDLAEPDRLARWSQLAADQALAAGAWTDAAIAAEQTLAASPSLTWAQAVDLHLLITEAASHDFDLRAASRHGAAAAQLARDHGAVDRWGRAVLHLARTLVTNGEAAVDTSETTALIEGFLHENLDADPSLRAQLLGLLSEIWGAENRIEEALDAATAARQLLTGDADAAVVTGVEVAEGMVRWARLDLSEARHAYEVAIRLTADQPAEKTGQYAAVRLNLVNHLAGDVERAAGAAPATMRRMADTQSWAEHALAAAAAAETALAQGRFEDVEQLGAVSERSSVRSSYPWSRVVALPAVALGRALRGDGTGAREAIEAMGAGAGTTARYHQTIDAVLGDRDRLREAVAARPWRPPAPHVTLQTLPGLVLHAEVAVAVGDPAMAAAALEPLRAAHQRGVLLSQGWTVLLSRLLGSCLLASGDTAEAERWLDVAQDEAVRLGLTVEAGRVALARAHLAEVTDAPDRVERAATAARLLDAVGALPLAAAARRLGRLDDQTAGPARRAVLFTDLIDSTVLNVQVGDAAFLELVQEHDAVVRACLRRHSGVEFKHTGDGIAAWFTDPGDAVRCGLAIGQDLERVSVLHPDLPFRVRTGIAFGEPLGHAGDLFGLSVVRAARLCALAEDREVLLSSEVLEGARPAGVHLHRRGMERLKGFPDPVEVYSAVALDAAALRTR